MLTYLRAGIPFMWEGSLLEQESTPKDEWENAQLPTEENFDPPLRHSLKKVVIEFPSLPARFYTHPLLFHIQGRSWSFDFPC